MTTPENNFGEWVTLPDGRRIRVLGYDDGSIRFRIEDDAPYMISEAFLTGSKNTIIKLVSVQKD